MAQLKIKVDTTSMAGLIDVHRQIKFATMNALTRVAWLTHDDEREEMIRKFDRPTDYVLKGLRVREASVAGITKGKHLARQARYVPNPSLSTIKVDDSSITAEVFFSDDMNKQSSPPSLFMAPHTHWGNRPHKRFEQLLIKAKIMQPYEFAVPTRHVKTDQYGNPAKGQLTQMLSYFKVFPESGYIMNRNIAKRQASVEKSLAKGRKPRPEVQYFVGKSDNGRYRAIFTRKAKTRKILPIWIFIDNVPHYKPIFEFWRVAEKSMVKNFEKQYDIQFKNAMATAKRYY